MIPAKQAKDGTNTEKYIKQKCEEIEESIKISMEMGLCYFIYRSSLPESIISMLKDLGYEVLVDDDGIMGKRHIIMWGKPEKEVKCN